MNSHNNTGKLNVEKLLQVTEAPVSMPAATRRKIRGQLLESLQTQNPGQKRRGWLFAAAAAFILALIGLWPISQTDGVLWAEVLDFIQQARTVSATMDTITTRKDGQIVRSSSRIYEQDPGLSRTEALQIGQTGEEILTSIVITRWDPRRTSQLTLTPSSKSAQLLTQALYGEARIKNPNRVADSWGRLQKISANHAADIGSKTINGVATVGFEVAGNDYFGDGAHSVQDAVLRLWVARESGQPVEMELEFGYPGGGKTITRMHSIEWDQTLDEQFFATTVPDNWFVDELHRQVFTFTDTSLLDGVSLKVQADRGQILVSENDLVAVHELELVRGRTGLAEARLILRLTSEAGERLDAWQQQHFPEILIANLNNDVRVVPLRPASDLLSVDLSRLDRSFQELVNGYVNPEWSDRVPDHTS